MQLHFSAFQIAQVVGGEIVGDSGVTVSDVSDIVNSREGTLCYVGDKKYLSYLSAAKASVVLISRDVYDLLETKPDLTLIIVDNARVAIAQLLSMVAEVLNPRRSGVEQPSYISDGVQVPDNAYIGAFAYIGKNVKLGQGVQIYPHVFIGDNVKIGDNTILYDGVKIYYNCVVGSNCIVHAGAVIGADGFGFEPDADGIYRKVPQIGNVVIGDDIEIGANTTIDRAMMGTTFIASNTKIDNLVQIGHNVNVGKSTVLCAQVGVAGSSNIGNHCILTGQVGVAGHLSICDNVVVGAQSGIPGDIKEPGQYMGYPVMPAAQWRRMAVVQKHLPELQREINKLTKQ